MPARSAVVLKILNGSAQHDAKKAKDERKIAPRRPPRIPPWAALQSPEVKVAYDYLMEEFVIEGIHGSPDGMLMQTLAEAFVLRARAMEKLMQFGPVMKHPSSQKPELQPYFYAVARYNEQILQIMKQLGFTPVSRMKLAPPLKDGPLGLPATWDEIE